MSAVLSGSPELAELERDTQSYQPSEQMLERAMDEVVDSLFRGQQCKCGKFRYDIQDALQEIVTEDECFDLVGRLVTADRSLRLELLDVFIGKLERDLRKEWAGHSIIEEKAIDMMLEAE